MCSTETKGEKMLITARGATATRATEQAMYFFTQTKAIKYITA